MTSNSKKTSGQQLLQGDARRCKASRWVGDGGEVGSAPGKVLTEFKVPSSEWYNLAALDVASHNDLPLAPTIVTLMHMCLALVDLKPVASHVRFREDCKKYLQR